MTLNGVLRGFSKRHRNITKIFEENYAKVKDIISEYFPEKKRINGKRKLLIGAYFTMEYSIESAAFFNPSIMEDPDQSNLRATGQKRVIVSFRATGEGHISSIVFRSGILDSNGDIKFEEAGRRVDVPENVRRFTYKKNDFIKKLSEMDMNINLVNKITEPLNSKFIYGELQAAISKYKYERYS